MISREEVEGLARLARLELGEEETLSIQRDISKILEYVGQVSAVSADKEKPVVPTHHNVMRDDTPRSDDDHIAGKETLLRAAFPKEENSFNVVRKIIQKDV